MKTMLDGAAGGVGWGGGEKAIQGLGKSQGSLLKKTYETFLCTESVLKTGLYGVFQSHPVSVLHG
jgi:hypothetical protein